MSVRGERIVYREREREVDTYEEPQRRSYTTIKRYQVPDRDDRSAVHEDVEEEKIVIRRERKDDHRGGRSEAGTRHSDRSSDRREEVDVRITERTTEREREPERRDVTYRIIERERDNDFDRRSGVGSRGDYRVVERERDFVRAPSPPEQERVREYRFERDREFSPPRTMTRERDFDVERYSKTTDYYGQPQPIIIRESAPQPIIIREERRAPQIIIRREEPAYEIIEREEVKEDQQLVVKEDTPPPPASTVKSIVKSTKSEVQKPQEEDYYYERRIREVRRRDDEVKPSDSASQYSSDDSYEYVRRERYVEDEKDPRHKLHLAEGALAGAAGAAIIRQHRKSQGKEDRHGGRNLLGGAALGALGAEAISRARSLRGSSRRREWEDDDDRGHKRGHRHRSRSYEREERRERSRSKSKSRAQKLGGLAAIAAVGALAGYAIKKSGEKNKETVIINEHGGRHRSRSRRRHSSVGSRYTEDDSKHTDAGQRNRRIAAAGAASAAAAGIWDRMRSKSRGGRERSKSRVRTGVPIVAAGLGGAALAGLYERNKANKEETRQQIIEDERNRGRHRSRSRSVPPYAIDDGRRRDGSMIAYGNDPIQRDGQRGYYDDEAPGSYRRRDRSVAGSPDNRRRSRSRAREFAPVAAGGVAGAAAAHEFGRDRSRSRSRAGRDRHYEDDRYSEDYPHGDYITPPPQGGNGYPNSNYSPPPPTEDRAAIDHRAYNDGYAPYNPADFPPAAAGAPREPYSESNATLGAPNPHDTFAGDVRFADQTQSTAEARERQEDREMRQAREHARADPGNVSTPPVNDRPASEDTAERADTSLDVNPSTPPLSRRPQVAFESPADSISYLDRLEGGRVNTGRSGSTTPRARSTSRVRFDLGSNVVHSPVATRHRQPSIEDTTEDSRDGPHDEEHRVGRSRDRRPSSTLMNDPYERRTASPGSDRTVDLPARFDEHGNRRSHVDGSHLATRLSEIFGGSSHGDGSRRGDAGGGGMIEQILHGIAGELLQGNDDNARPDRRSRR